MTFFDSYGNPVKPGDKIIIEKHYCYTYFENKEAEVFWDEKRGVMKFKFYSDRLWTESNFYGVHSFKKIIETKS